MKKLRLLAYGLLLAVTLPVASLVYAASTVSNTVPNDVQVGYREFQGELINQILAVLRNLQTNAVNSVTASQSIAAGERALGGANPTTFASGLTTIANCTLTVATISPTDVTLLTYTRSAGNLSVFAWKPITTTNTALTATASVAPFGWHCFGTL